MNTVKILFSIPLLVILIVNCNPQSDSTNSLIGRDANALLLSNALLGASLGQQSGTAPRGTEITCSDGRILPALNPSSGSSFIVSSLLLVELLGLEDFLSYSRIDVQRCADTTLLAYGESERINASTRQKNDTCNENNAGSIDPLILIISTCEINRVIRSTNSSSRSSGSGSGSGSE